MKIKKYDEFDFTFKAVGLLGPGNRKSEELYQKKFIKKESVIQYKHKIFH